MLEAYNLLDLLHRISLTDTLEGESHFVGSKLSLTTRFVVYIYNAITYIREVGMTFWSNNKSGAVCGSTPVIP